MGQLAADIFTRADETPLASPWVSGGYAGRTMNLVSNHAEPNAALDTTAHYTGVTWPDDQWSFADLTVSGGTGGGDGPGVMVRWSTDAVPSSVIDGYWLVASHGATNNVWLWRVDTGNFVSLFGLTMPWSDGDRFGLRVTGPSTRAFLEIYYGAAPKRAMSLIGTALDTSGGISPTGSAAGIVYSSAPSGAQIDNWAGGTGAIDERKFFTRLPKRLMMGRP